VIGNTDSLLAALVTEAANGPAAFWNAARAKIRHAGSSFATLASRAASCSALWNAIGA
jgi:hypothetical protein